MECLCAQLRSWKDSPSKVLVQPNEVLGFGGGAQCLPLFFLIRNSYSSHPGCSQTESPSLSLL